jgi:hypothetical protein
MGEEKSKRRKLRWWVIWLVAALCIESGALLFFFVINRSLRAELREAQVVAKPSPKPDAAALSDSVTGSFIYRVAAPALATATPFLHHSTAPRDFSLPANVEPRGWKFIVIHHSATPSGSAQAFEAYHRSRGMSNGLAYHFVVCNGTNDTEDGEVEIGSRWIKQLAGGHCKQESVNGESIGICLVGDFTHRLPSDKQMETLARLVFDLQKQFAIPAANVLGHGHVVGEFSECPGKSFPWEAFRAALAKVAEADRAEKLAAFSIQPIAPPIRP